MLEDVDKAVSLSCFQFFCAFLLISKHFNNWQFLCHNKQRQNGRNLKFAAIIYWRADTCK